MIKKEIYLTEGDKTELIILGMEHVDTGFLLADFYNHKVKFLNRQENISREVYKSRFGISQVRLLNNGFGIITFESLEGGCNILLFQSFYFGSCYFI